MLADIDAQLHATARLIAKLLRDPDKKQLRFNEIVSAAKDFYPPGSVTELVTSCARSEGFPELIGPTRPNPMYVPGRPLWQTLREDYGWMLDHEGQEDINDAV